MSNYKYENINVEIIVLNCVLSIGTSLVSFMSRTTEHIVTD